MYIKRLEKLKSLLAEKEIDGVLLIGNPNRNYLSGFTGDESYSVITENESIFITDSRYTEQANQQVKGYEVIQYSSSVEDFIEELVKKLNIKVLGFEEDVVPFSFYSNLKNKLSCSLVPLEGLIESIRIIKDDTEIESMRNAAKIADQAFEFMKGFIKAGMTEREVALELEFYMKKLGAKELSFPSIVASGYRSSLPHGEPTNKVINHGEFLTLDYGCVYEDYCSDMTRTFIVGEASDRMLEVYDTVLKAQEMALEAIKPGVRAFEVDKIAREYIKSKGFGEYFGHGLGHGVGRQIHEAPRVNTKSQVVLQPGMVITDEPGIYIPDFGGVRIEDLVVVTEDGFEVLSNSTKNLIIL